MNGKGLFVWCDGRRYIGQYLNDQKHGKGKMIWPDGRAWKGMWKKGQMHGKGKFFSFKQDNVASIALSKKEKMNLGENNTSHLSKKSQQSASLQVKRGIWTLGKFARWRTEEDSDSNDSENEEEQKQQLELLKKQQLRNKQFVNQSKVDDSQDDDDTQQDGLFSNRFAILNKFVKSAVTFIGDKTQPLKQSYIEAKDYMNDKIDRKKRKWNETEKEAGVLSRFKQFISPAKYQPPPMELTTIQENQQEKEQQNGEVQPFDQSSENLKFLVQTVQGNQPYEEQIKFNEEQQSQRSQLQKPKTNQDKVEIQEDKQKLVMQKEQKANQEEAKIQEEQKQLVLQKEQKANQEEIKIQEEQEQLVLPQEQRTMMKNNVK